MISLVSGRDLKGHALPGPGTPVGHGRYPSDRGRIPSWLWKVVLGLGKALVRSRRDERLLKQKVPHGTWEGSFLVVEGISFRKGKFHFRGEVSS